jgi:predicted neutral ceramidase superfamily lipid hydrolase
MTLVTVTIHLAITTLVVIALRLVISTLKSYHYLEMYSSLVLCALSVSFCLVTATVSPSHP